MDKRMPAFVLCLAALVLAAASFLRLMQDRAAESMGLLRRRVWCSSRRWWFISFTVPAIKGNEEDRIWNTSCM